MLTWRFYHMSVCWFDWVFSSLSRIFHSIGRVIIASVEGMQILTYARHPWQLNNEGLLAFRTYCDTGYPFLWSSPYTYCRAFGSGAVSTCFKNLCHARLGFEHSTYCLSGQRFNGLRHRRGQHVI